MPSEFTPFRRGPLTITIAGTRISIPYRPAAVWISSLEHVSQMAASLADEDGWDRIIDLSLGSSGASTELKQESLRILSEATGRPWWEAGRLINTSTGSEILGRMVLAGVDPWQRSIGEWCAAVYALCIKGQDDKARLRFDFMLSIPPVGYEDAWDDGGDDPEATAAAVQSWMTGG